MGAMGLPGDFSGAFCFVSAFSVKENSISKGDSDFMNNRKVIFALISMIVCIFLSACAEQNGSKENSAAVIQGENIVVSQQSELNSLIPQNITMEFFDINLLEVNRPIWEKEVYSLIENGGTDNGSTNFYVGDYEIFHGYSWVEPERNFSATINYDNNFGSFQLSFDANDKLKEILIRSDPGSEFSTSFLRLVIM